MGCCATLMLTVTGCRTGRGPAVAGVASPGCRPAICALPHTGHLAAGAHPLHTCSGACCQKHQHTSYSRQTLQTCAMSACLNAQDCPDCRPVMSTSACLFRWRPSTQRAAGSYWQPRQLMSWALTCPPATVSPASRFVLMHLCDGWHDCAAIVLCNSCHLVQCLYKEWHSSNAVHHIGAGGAGVHLQVRRGGLALADGQGWRVGACIHCHQVTQQIHPVI